MSTRLVRTHFVEIAGSYWISVPSTEEWTVRLASAADGVLYGWFGCRLQRQETRQTNHSRLFYGFHHTRESFGWSELKGRPRYPVRTSKLSMKERFAESTPRTPSSIPGRYTFCSWCQDYFTQAATPRTRRTSELKLTSEPRLAQKQNRRLHFKLLPCFLLHCFGAVTGLPLWTVASLMLPPTWFDFSSSPSLFLLSVGRWRPSAFFFFVSCSRRRNG